MNQVPALVWKDVLIHWRTAGALVVGWPVFLRLLLLMNPGDPSATRPLAGLTTLLSVGTVTPIGMAMATWLVEQERTKETFAWLRALPVSDAHIVLSKFATVLVFYLLGGAAWLLVLGGVGPAMSVSQFLSAWSVAFMLACLALLFQFISTSRFGATTPALLVVLVFLAGQPISRSPDTVAAISRWWGDPWGHVWLWSGCLATEAVVIWIAWLRFRAQDAHRVVA